MIGQQKLKENINNFIINNNFPKVCIILGRSGFGKSTCVNYIANNLHINDICEIKSIEDVRNTIYNAPNLSHDIIIHIPSFESLNFRAKEILLKICEDVPKNIYICIEVTNYGICEDRFLNRAYLFELEPYTYTELSEIVKTFKYDITEDDLTSVLSIVGSPTNIKECLDYGVPEYYTFITKVINNITKAQAFNAMKICDKLSTKNSDGLISFSLFFNSVINLSFKNYRQTLDLDMLKLFDCATSNYNDLLLCPMLNKKMVFDKFVLELKGECV